MPRRPLRIRPPRYRRRAFARLESWAQLIATAALAWWATIALGLPVVILFH